MGLGILGFLVAGGLRGGFSEGAEEEIRPSVSKETAPSAEASSPPSAPAPSEGPGGGKKAKRIQVEDRLRVKIYPEDEYIKGGEVEVSTEGTITLPLVGKITVQGRRVSEAEEEIARILQKDYLVSPVVVIEVMKRVSEKDKKTASILGQVHKPGSYEIPSDKGMTLLELISQAGGFTEIANVKKIKIIRKEGGKAQGIHANAESIISGKDPDIELRPDDVVHVGESFF